MARALSPHDLDAAIVRTDKALYEAKRRQRNTVVAAPDDSTASVKA